LTFFYQSIFNYALDLLPKLSFAFLSCRTRSQPVLEKSKLIWGTTIYVFTKRRDILMFFSDRAS